MKKKKKKKKKSSPVINVKKQRETKEWERLEISSRKLAICKGIFHGKMSTVKDRKSKHLAEAEDIKKRWQEYTEELYKKDIHDPDNHDGVITHQTSWNVESSGP